MRAVGRVVVRLWLVVTLLLGPQPVLGEGAARAAGETGRLVSSRLARLARPPAAPLGAGAGAAGELPLRPAPAAAATVLVSNATPGYYNAALGTILDGTQPQFPGPGDDPLIQLASEPTLSAASSILGGWLAANPLPLNSNWSSGVQAIPATWALTTETAILYPIDAGTAGISNLRGNFDVDNGIYVWVNGVWVQGARPAGWIAATSTSTSTWAACRPAEQLHPDIQRRPGATRLRDRDHRRQRRRPADQSAPGGGDCYEDTGQPECFVATTPDPVQTLTGNLTGRTDSGHARPRPQPDRRPRLQQPRRPGRAARSRLDP
jgi:hypothetical protein